MKFFTGHSSSDPVISAVARFVKGQNEKYNFLSSLTKRIGFPYWDKSIVAAKSYSAKGSSADSTNVVYIPFARDTEQRVNAALIIAMKPADTSFRFLYDWQYAAYGFDTTTHTEKWNARDVFHIFSLFDKSVFNITHFRITDNNLLTSSERETIRLSGLNADSVEVLCTLKEFGQKGNNAQDIIPVEICDPYSICIQPCPKAEARGASANSLGYCCEIALEMEECTTYYFDDGSGGGGLPPPPTDTGSGGGGGTGGPGDGWQDPCSGSPALPRGEGVPPCGDPGWLPIPPDDGDVIPYSSLGYHHFDTWDVSNEDNEKIQNWNQNDIDTIGLDKCVRAVLDKILNSNTSIGKMLTKMERGIFKENSVDKFKLKIRVGSVGSNVNAQTLPGNYNTATGVFTDTITLGHGLVDSATEIGMAKTIIHEVVHAYLNFIFNKWFYSNFTPTQISGMPYDTLFNKYIDSMLVINNQKGLNSWISNDRQKDHSYMADHFLEPFAEILKSVDNGRNSEEYYWLIGWSGLMQSRTMKFYWPNYSSTPPTNWPPSNPAPSNDSTWGLKYALTQARLDSLAHFAYREYSDTSKSKGRKHISGGCY